MHDNLLLYTGVVLVTVLTPGAGVMYTLTCAFRYGPAYAFYSPLGNTLGTASMTIITICGLGAVIRSDPVIFVSLQALGALVLLYLAWKNWTAAPMTLNACFKTQERDNKKGISLLVGASLLQVTNPMLIVFLLSLFPQFIDPKEPYLPQITVLAAIFFTTCLTIHLGYSYCASFLGAKFMSSRFSFWLNKISAVIFVLLAVSVFVKLFNG